jgi:dimeric dUTPase (all-alpha-NTP-PPase superfamily)
MEPEDKLRHMFELREQFMKSLKSQKSGIYPKWPVDLTDKNAQQTVRDTALKGVEEVFEAMQHFKNWKSHRTTEDKTFDREKFLEEMVDSFNYFFSVLVLTGVTADELYEAYVAKDAVIHERLKTGY